MRTTLLITGLLWGIRLFAQDAEIVVTATKEPTLADTVPVPVIVLGPEELEGKNSVSDALNDTLAVRLQSQTPGDPALIAPGFGENGFGRISVMLDGISQDNVDMAPPPLNLVPVFALERIEIVRGPMSALYGSGAGGGAVNLITKTPDRFVAQLSGGVETGGSNTQSVAFGVPVAQGGLLLSLQRTQELPSRDRSDSDSYQGWTKFSLPQGDQRFDGWLGFTHDDAQLPGGLTKAQFEADPHQATNPDDSTLRNETLGGVSWSLSQGEWKISIPISGLVRVVRFTTPSSPSFSDSTLYRASWEPSISAKTNFWGADAEGSAGLSVAVDYLSFKRYSDKSFSSQAGWALVDRWTESAWSRGQLNWGDHWFLSTDVRVETSRTQADSNEAAVRGFKDFLPVAGDVGLTWLPVAGWKTALQLSRVYSYPFIDAMIYYHGFSDQFLDNIDAEVGHGATISASWTDGTWAISASGTGLRMENEVALNDSGVNANIGPVWHVSSLASVSWKTDVSAAAVLLGADYDGQLAVFAEGPHRGKTIPLIPMHRGKLWTGLENKRLGNFKASWTMTSSYYQGEDFDNVVSPVPLRQNVDIDSVVFLGSSEWALHISVHNLLDDRTPDEVYGYYYLGFNESNGWYPSEGRVFGISLTWTM